LGTVGSVEESVPQAIPVSHGLSSPSLPAVSTPVIPLDGQALLASFRMPAVKDHQSDIVVPFPHEAIQFRLVAAHDKDDPLRGSAHRLSRC
jgi:hypothetical protein